MILLCVVFTALFPVLIASQSPTDQNLDVYKRQVWNITPEIRAKMAASKASKSAQ